MPVGPTLRRAVNAMRENRELDPYTSIWQAATGMSLDYYMNTGNVVGPDGVTLKQHNDFRYAVITLQNYLRQEYGWDGGVSSWYRATGFEDGIEIILACALKDETS